MRKTIIVLLLLFVCLPLFSRPVISDERKEEPFSFIGMKLEDMFRRFGPPKSVYAARGDQPWQDDIVFVYDAGDFYIFRDRIWQVGVKSVFGIKIGDVKAVALLVFGDNVRDEGDYLLYNITGGGWPVSIRVNFSSGRVSNIFVYRPDFQ